MRCADGNAEPGHRAVGDHDALFKRAFGVPQHAAAELRCVLPTSACERLDLDALALMPASFVDAELAHRHADLLFRVPIRDRPGKAAYVYVLLEHQSEPDHLMAWRVFGYLHRIWAAILREEPHRKSLPPIVTVVVHHGAGGWTAPRRFHELVEDIETLPELAPLIPDFELVIDDLGAIADEALRTRPIPPFPKLALWLLRDGRQLEAFFTHLAAWAEEIRELARRDPAHEDRAVLARYILRVAGEIPSELLRQRIAKDAPEFEESMASAAEQLIEQGRTIALRETLERLLRTRFGDLDQGIEQRIATASPTDLDRWLERVITAERPDDILEP